MGAAFVTRLQARIAALVQSGELTVPVSISAGMTHYPADSADAHTLFAIADVRLYEAKRASAA
jgi:GGDEF domain-containing protein